MLASASGAVCSASPPRPAASSPPRRARHSPARWPLLPGRPPAPVLRHRSPEPSSGMAAASSRTAALGPGPGSPGRPGNMQLPGCCARGREALAPAPPPRPPLPPPARGAVLLLAPAGSAAAHTLTPRAPPRLPAGGGWGRVRPLASFAAFLSPRPFCRSRATGIQILTQKTLQSPGREVKLRGRPASGLGAALAGFGCPDSRVRRGRGRRGLWLWRARSVQRKLGWGQRAGAAGSTEAPEAPRARRGAETSGRPNLPRKLTK